VTAGLLKVTDVPVEVIVGREVFPIERFGVPVGLAVAMVMVLSAALAGLAQDSLELRSLTEGSRAATESSRLRSFAGSYATHVATSEP
jgi:hypothetical protein